MGVRRAKSAWGVGFVKQSRPPAHLHNSFGTNRLWVNLLSGAISSTNTDTILRIFHCGIDSLGPAAPPINLPSVAVFRVTTSACWAACSGRL
jgi:hypothetical protein